MSDLTIPQKIGLIGYYYYDKMKTYFRDLKLSDPKAWNQSLWNLYGMGQSESGIDVSHDTALNYSAVFNAIAIISGTIGALPCHVYKRRKSGGKDLATDHPVDILLHVRPNSEMTAMNFRETGAAHMLSWGNWFSETVGNSLGQLTDLWPITPNRVKIDRRNGNIIYKITVGAEEVILPREKILHIPGLGFDGLMGYSVLTKARESIGLGLAAERFGARYFGSNTHPGLILKHPGQLGDEARTNLKDAAKAYEGLGKSHRFMIIEEGMDVVKIGIPPNDSQFLETRQHQVTDIARWFNIPPHKLKELSRATFSNIEEQSIEFVVDTIMPWLVRIEQNYNMQLLTPKELRLGYFIKHNVNALLRGKATERAEFYGKMFNIGAYSINDILELEDKNPIDGGDTRFVPLNMQRLEDAIKEPEPIPIPISNQDNSNENDQIAQKSSYFWEKILQNDQEAVKMIEHRSVIGRDRISSQYYPLIKDAAQRIVNKEARAIKKAIKLNREKRGARDLKKWLDEFYRSLPDYIRKQMEPVINSFIEATAYQSLNEINAEPEILKELENFINQYFDAYILRHINRSFFQVEGLLDNEELPDFDDRLTRVDVRMDEWMDKRSDKIATEESVRASSAVAQFVFWAGGYASVWRIRGEKTCPYCTALNGRKVGMGEKLFDGGENWEPDGAKDGPMKVRYSLSHPPLHQKCDCYISFR